MTAVGGGKLVSGAHVEKLAPTSDDSTIPMESAQHFPRSLGGSSSLGSSLPRRRRLVAGILVGVCVVAAALAIALAIALAAPSAGTATRTLESMFQDLESGGLFRGGVGAV